MLFPKKNPLQIFFSPKNFNRTDAKKERLVGLFNITNQEGRSCTSATRAGRAISSRASWTGLSAGVHILFARDPHILATELVGEMIPPSGNESKKALPTAA